MVLLLDVRRDPTDEDFMLLEWLARRELPALIVITKADKVKRTDVNKKLNQVERELGAPAIAFSVKSGLGKNELVAAMLELVAENRRT
jgi:GTP-binding protein